MTNFPQRPSRSETHLIKYFDGIFCILYVHPLSRVSSRSLLHPSTTVSSANMGCAPSKPSRSHSRDSETHFPHYTGPKEFRGSVMPERRPHRQAAQMYQTYQKLDQQRGIKEKRRYSWEGHSSEKVLTTFDQLAQRGVIPKGALKKK